MVKVPGRVGIVEALGKAVDEDAGIRARHNHPRVGAVLVVQRQEARPLRKLRRLGNGLLVTPLVGAVGGSGGADTGNAQEATAADEQAEDDDGKRHADSGVDAVLNGGKDSHQDTRQEDDHLDGRHTPELDDNPQRRDDVADGVDDDGRQRRVGDVKEERRQRVQSQQNDNGGDDTGKGRADTGLGLDGGSGKGARRRVRAQEGAQQVGHANGHQLLRRIDDVVVDSAERLGDGYVLNQHHDDGRRELRRKGLDDALVDRGGARVLEACHGRLSKKEKTCQGGEYEYIPRGTLPRMLIRGCAL